MKRLRLIARLDVKFPNLIKGIHLEGLRVLGQPELFAQKYYEAGADELIYMDIVASLYNRNSLGDLVQKTSKKSFIPLTVGGGIRTVQDAKEILRSGADKIAINTAAIKNPAIISEMSKKFGAQCVVLSIEAKKEGNSWQAYHDNGREFTGKDVVAWAKQGEELGAGEILLTSVDKEGTRKGFDLELTKAVSEAVQIPVIASGGFGKPQDIIQVSNIANADAVAIADGLHYNRFNIHELKSFCRLNDMKVRMV